MAFLPLLVGGGIYAAAALGGGFGLTFIKNKRIDVQMLPGNVRKVIRTIETNKIARIFAGIFTFGFSELMNHKEVSVEYFYEDQFIERGAAEELYEKGNEYKENLKRVRQKIKEEAEKRVQEKEAERIKREAAEREARKEALRLERARTQLKSLLEEANNIYQQAEAMSSLELKLENYEVALYKCEESCAFGATEETFKTLNKIFESCLKHDAHDEAESAVQIVRKYFPSEAGHLQDILVRQQNISWSPDYESRARRLQEQNKNVMILFK